MVGESVGDLTQWQDRRAQTLESMQMVMGPLPDRSDLESLVVEVIETSKVAGIERRKISYLAEQGRCERGVPGIGPPCKRSVDCLQRIL